MAADQSSSTGTTRETTLEELRESEARYRVLVEHSPDAIVILDMVEHGRFVDCNRRACELFRVPREDLLRGGPADFSPPMQPNGRPSDELARDYIGRCLAGEFPSFEWTHRTGDGQDVPCEVRLARLPMAGRFLVCGAISDISYRLAVAAERRALEARVLQAEKLESLGLMAGGVAHDFNNLLASILGFAELALAEVPNQHPVAERVRNIQRAATAAGDLTKELLAYAGKADLQTEPVDLGALVRDLGELLRVALPTGVVLSLDLPTGLPPVEADVGQLRQVVMNLITNAAEASAGRAAEVRVRLREADIDDRHLAAMAVRAPTARAGRFVVLEVQDDGPGMSAATASRVFDPFFTTKASGHGLGLATVAGIARANGGAVTVTSVFGRGTTFEVLFEVSTASAAGVEPAGAMTSRLGEGARALVVDDEEVVRDVAAAMLETLGFQVDACDSGEAALEQLEGEPAVRLMLVDLGLRGMNGQQLLARASQISPGTAAIATSGYSSAEAGPLPDGVPFVGKPFSLARLRQAAEELLR